MLYVSFIHNADILPIAASAATNQLELMNDAISPTNYSIYIHMSYSLITCQTSATVCSKQPIRCRSMHYATMTVATALSTATMDGAIMRGYTRIESTIPVT